jgi:hypothetical protein
MLGAVHDRVSLVPGSLTFDQVKKARVFAWHERHYVFANDTLLRVVTPYRTSGDDPSPPHADMVIRPSSLQGTEHLLDQGWHHLSDCSCRYCTPGRSDAGLGCKSRNGCHDPGT